MSHPDASNIENERRLYEELVKQHDSLTKEADQAAVGMANFQRRYEEHRDKALAAYRKIGEDILPLLSADYKDGKCQMQKALEYYHKISIVDAVRAESPLAEPEKVKNTEIELIVVLTLHLTDALSKLEVLTTEVTTLKKVKDVIDTSKARMERVSRRLEKAEAEVKKQNVPESHIHENTHI